MQTRCENSLNGLRVGLQNENVIQIHICSVNQGGYVLSILTSVDMQNEYWISASITVNYNLIKTHHEIRPFDSNTLRANICDYSFHVTPQLRLCKNFLKNIGRGSTCGQYVHLRSFTA